MDPHDGQALAASLGDPLQFEVVFKRHFDVVHRYLARRVGDDVADDLVAQVFAEAFAGRHRFDVVRPSAAPWLFGIATNLLRRHRRREIGLWRRYAAIGVDPLGVVSHQPEVAGNSVLAGALARLTRGDRDALLLFAWADLDYAAISVALGIPIGTVRSRIHRARRQLREALRAADDEKLEVE